MFTNCSNQKLYSFDTIAVAKTGTLKVSNNTGERRIEFAPISLSTLYNFTSVLDMTWDGAVVTFDGTTPIYRNSDKRGLWVTVEYPPTISVSTES